METKTTQPTPHQSVCGGECQNVIERGAEYCSEACAGEDGAPACYGCGTRLGSVEDRTPEDDTGDYRCDECAGVSRESACYHRDVMGVAL